MTDEEISRTVADDLPVGVWVARAPGGEFVYANKTFAEIMGVAARSDVAAGSYAEPYQIRARTGELYPEHRMPFVQAVQARKTIVVDDIVIHRPDGRRAHIRARARPIFDGERISHVVIAFIDITREVDAQLAQEEGERRLQRAQRLESIGTLAGGIAHDFNNLLATIKVTASTLRLREADDDRRAALQLIDDVTSSAAELTRSLLGFARRGKNLAVPVSVNAVVRTVGQLAHRIMEGRICVMHELNAESDHVLGDFSQLEQVVMNLVVNGRDAITGPGGVLLRTFNRPGQLVLEVSDTGSGIDPSIRDRVFEPYFTTKTAGPQRGTGLGLATVYGIVEAHGGGIELTDNVPKGTTFRITLPLCVQPVQGNSSVPVAEPEQAQTAGEGRLVLVVEDEPNVGSALAAGLEALGYRVLLATTGDEGVSMFREYRAKLDAVVLDMVMPKMGGRDAFLAMRQIDPKIPVLLTTGSSHNEEVQRILDLGVAGFLPRPFPVTRLSEELRRALAKP